MKSKIKVGQIYVYKFDIGQICIIESAVVWTSLVLCAAGWLFCASYNKDIEFNVSKRKPNLYDRSNDLPVYVIARKTAAKSVKGKKSYDPKHKIR